MMGVAEVVGIDILYSHINTGQNSLRLSQKISENSLKNQ